MPIANCIVRSDCYNNSCDLVKLWADESGQSSEQMTVNMIISDHQCGQRFSVMATLWLPSIWSNAGVCSLQTGLARALARYFDIAVDEVQVITQMVNSGMVVEKGQEIRW